MPDGSGPVPPPSAELGRVLDTLLAQYIEHARITGSPLDYFVARVLALAREFRERANVGKLERADWLDHLEAEAAPFLLGKRNTPLRGGNAPRVVMTVAEVARLFEWGKERTRRWLRRTHISITRSGNKDLVLRRDVENAAKIRLRLRQNKIAQRYKSR